MDRGSIPAVIVNLTGITNEDVAHPPLHADMLVDFYKFVRSNFLITHHSQHEQAFMKQTARESQKISFHHRIIDASFLIAYSILPTSKLHLRIYPSCAELSQQADIMH
ncbi:hypothetical protein AM500_23815 [Bacillus sp. FJAT-18017]|uniref:hypothetical protein n=1 Tax=Bacillus sp. FJAT-18017 TaxID=1705566 RepID=UPI0006ADEDE3|nr:hypothetical protein [Bacillus sp. FJAT-18017]ALC92453.1 hypothetical protein AM500_23815 [Bacillus sp. FJAT-18017]